LLDSELPRKIKLLRAAWPQATLNFVSTLGEPVDGAFLDALWENGLNRLDVSFYGYTPEWYEKIHGVPRFGQASANLRQVLESSVRKRLGGEVRIRTLHVEEQMPFSRDDHSETASAWKARMAEYSGVSFLDTWLMSQAGAAPLCRERATTLPCDIAWGEFARALYVTWELDVALCCATTGDEFTLGNLRENSLEDIFSGEKYTRFIRAMRENRLGEYPFCRNCERHVNGTAQELIRVASWQIANILKDAPKTIPFFSIVGEPRLAGPLNALYQRHFPEYLPVERLPELARSGRPVLLFVVAQGKSQIFYCRDAQKTAAVLGEPAVTIIPVLGVGFPQEQATITSLAELYAAAEITCSDHPKQQRHYSHSFSGVNKVE
jgi:radical SAM protein with 4Fe4S-binding SPASM domain